MVSTGALLAIEKLVNSPVLHEHITEDHFRRVNLDAVSEAVRNTIKSIEESIPVPKSVSVAEHRM